MNEEEIINESLSEELNINRYNEEKKKCIKNI